MPPGRFLRQFRMRLLALLLIAVTVAGQSALRVQVSHTTESLRGASVVTRDIAWVSGTHGTYLRTIDGGRTWTPAEVPGSDTLDFRAVVAFSAGEAFLMSSGTGDQSRIYHTSDAGQHWQLQFTNPNPKGFFDSMVFWDRRHGIVLGDPIPDESGKLKFELLLTDDGQTWHPIPPSQLPPAFEGEGAFAASNTCITILGSPSINLGAGMSGPSNGWKRGASAPRQPTKNDRALAPEGPDSNIWFASGGTVARVFHSPDRGQTWQVIDTPIIRGPDSAGIFSIAFRDALHGVIAGGDYKHPDDDGPNLAFTEDSGKTWTLSPIRPQAFFSALAYARHVNEEVAREAMSPPNKKKTDPPSHRLFAVSQEFILDFRGPANPRRISPKKKLAMKFNAASAYPEGGALIVGPKGVIATIR